MARPILSHSELDLQLDRFAEEPESFAESCERWIEELDREGTPLEVCGTASWRRDVQINPNLSFVDQFRADVDSIETIAREPEAKLARRIEFARLRLAHARRQAGVVEEELFEGIGQLAQGWMTREDSDAVSPASDWIMCRAAELHALRLEMVERNLYLVLINVERYVISSRNRADLIQEGSAALFRAVDGFDWRRGLLFRTYAVHWLNQAFRNYLYNHSNTVRVPVYLQKAMKQIRQAQVKLGDAKASPERIAELTDLTESVVHTALTAIRASQSLDAEMGSDSDGNRLRDLLVHDEDADPYTTDLEEITLSEGLGTALERLGDRERVVVGMRFGLDGAREHTLSEVAAQLGVSVERVRQIQVRALSKLDTPTLRRDLEPFLSN